MENIYRTTKCFGVNGQGKIKGAFPKGFIEWIKRQGWIGEKRCYLCAGMIDDKDSFRVDVRPEVNPDLLADATDTKLPSEEFDWIMIDPPYTKDLAMNYYGTDANYHGINAFTKEAERLCKPNGLILTLSYEIPKRIKNCEFIAVVGIYTVPFTGYMRCFTVSRKTGGTNFTKSSADDFPLQESLISVKRESADSQNSPHDECCLDFNVDKELPECICDKKQEEANFS